jgi:hypothetical protein
MMPHEAPPVLTHWERLDKLSIPLPEEPISAGAPYARYPALAVSMHTEPPRRRRPTPPAALRLVAGVRFMRSVLSATG